MRILKINKFFYPKGGSELYMFRLSELLDKKGNETAFFSMIHENNKQSEWNGYFIENIDYHRRMSVKNQLKVLKKMLYSREAYSKTLKIIDEFKPDVAHIYNFNHQLTPSVLFASKERGVPVVTSVSDYKIVCPSYLMLNHGNVCERCKGKRFYNCLFTRCHKGSFKNSLAVLIESYLHHKVLNSYGNIDRFICPSVFVMNKIREMGLKGDCVHLPCYIDVNKWKPDGVSDRARGKNILFCGRLSREKGVLTLIDAVNGLDVNLTIVGEGPFRKEIERGIKARGLNNVRLTGYLDTAELMERIKESLFLIVPSEWYEVFGLVIVEAFAFGLPVIGADIGAIPELVKEGENGLLFVPGNAADLRAKIKYFLDNPGEARRMGKNAREFVEKKFNEDKYYGEIMNAYRIGGRT
jgi:glycosyltransferase involved in cell wall biosynthesis